MQELQNEIDKILNSKYSSEIKIEKLEDLKFQFIFKTEHDGIDLQIANLKLDQFRESDYEVATILKYHLEHHEEIVAEAIKSLLCDEKEMELLPRIFYQNESQLVKFGILNKFILCEKEFVFIHGNKSYNTKGILPGSKNTGYLKISKLIDSYNLHPELVAEIKSQIFSKSALTIALLVDEKAQDELIKNVEKLFDIKV